MADWSHMDPPTSRQTYCKQCESGETYTAYRGRLYAKRIEPYIKLVFRFFIWWRNSLRALSYPVAET